MKGYKIDIEIYAENEQEAENGRNALVTFIEIMRRHGAAVRGSKLSEAVASLDKNQFVKSQIINFFRSI